MFSERSEMFFRPRQMSGASQKAAKMTAGRREFCRREITSAGRSKLRRTRFAPDKCQGRELGGKRKSAGRSKLRRTHFAPDKCQGRELGEKG